MEGNQSFLTITKTEEFLFKEKGSKFIGFAIPVDSREELKSQLHELKERFPDATHHCYGCILGVDGEHEYFNDDGEPGNTAGRPILRQIQSRDLTHVLVVVVRYYGGKKLGVPGLIHAYSESASGALDKCLITTSYIKDYYEINCDFADEHQVYTCSQMFEGEVIDATHGNRSILKVKVKADLSEEFVDCIKQNYRIEIQWYKRL